MDLSYVVDWVLDNIELGDKRRARALGEMAWGLAVAGKVSFTEIGRAIEGKATAASKHKRVHRFCHNENVDPAAVQSALFQILVADALRRHSEPGPHVVPLAIDWHTYDNGAMCGLRVSLITGSRALPLMWYETRPSALKNRQTEIERQAIENLVRLRPPGVTWLLVLDCGFHASTVLDALGGAGYFVVRSQVHVLVHSPVDCWMRTGDLPVRMGSLVEFGWLTWSGTSPRTVRMVAARMPPVSQRNRRSSPRHKKKTQPGYCPLLTNLPEHLASAEDVLKIYLRRFEIEHSFRDIKSATLGLDMEHVHLKSVETYARLLCIVAVAEAVLWLCGAEAEHLELRYAHTSSRPRSGRRVLSLVRLGRLAISAIRAPIRTLIRRHLRFAILSAKRATGTTWRQPRKNCRLRTVANSPAEVPRLDRRCRRKHKGEPFVPCQAGAGWKLVKVNRGAATKSDTPAARAA